LDLKYVKSVPSATPAADEMAEVGACPMPRSANSSVAASRIAFLLLSLFGRAKNHPWGNKRLLTHLI
jgi:hypothetical protein